MLFCGVRRPRRAAAATAARLIAKIRLFPAAYDTLTFYLSTVSHFLFIEKFSENVKGRPLRGGLSL